jgi:hypothetical protein
MEQPLQTTKQSVQRQVSSARTLRFWDGTIRVLLFFTPIDNLRRAVYNHKVLPQNERLVC